MPFESFMNFFECEPLSSSSFVLFGIETNPISITPEMFKRDTIA